MYNEATVDKNAASPRLLDTHWITRKVMRAVSSVIYLLE